MINVLGLEMWLKWYSASLLALSSEFKPQSCQEKKWLRQ
jgi:hypothetical protein